MNFLKKNSRFVLIFSILFLALQIINLIIFSLYGVTYINSKFIFGLLYTNNIALICSVLLTILLSFFVTTSKEKIMYVLIAASVFSNIADRLLYDGVIDYIKLGNAIVFNLADVFILSGIVLLFSNKIFILMSKTK